MWLEILSLLTVLAPQKRMIIRASLVISLIAFCCASLPIAVSQPGPVPLDSPEQIRVLYDNWVEATNEKDIERWLIYLDEDAVFLPPGHAALESRDEIIDFYSDLFMDPNFALTCRQTFVEVSASNDIAWARGTCNATFTAQDGELGSGTSKWSKVWRRSESGEWKCRLNTWNYDE